MFLFSESFVRNRSLNDISICKSAPRIPVARLKIILNIVSSNQYSQHPSLLSPDTVPNANQLLTSSQKWSSSFLAASPNFIIKVSDIVSWFVSFNEAFVKVGMCSKSFDGNGNSHIRNGKLKQVNFKWFLLQVCHYTTILPLDIYWPCKGTLWLIKVLK